MRITPRTPRRRVPQHVPKGHHWIAMYSPVVAERWGGQNQQEGRKLSGGPSLDRSRSSDHTPIRHSSVLSRSSKLGADNRGQVPSRSRSCPMGSRVRETKRRERERKRREADTGPRRAPSGSVRGHVRGSKGPGGVCCAGTEGCVRGRPSVPWGRGREGVGCLDRKVARASAWE